MQDESTKKIECTCHCHSETEEDRLSGIQCRCIKNCEHCHPENFKEQTYMNKQPAYLKEIQEDFEFGHGDANYLFDVVIPKLCDQVRNETIDECIAAVYKMRDDVDWDPDALDSVAYILEALKTGETK